MKQNQILSLVLKVLGLVLAWKALTGFFLVISQWLMFFKTLSHSTQGLGFWLISIVFTTLTTILLPALGAWLLISKSERIVKLLGVKEDDVEMPAKKYLYHTLVVVLGSIMIIVGASKSVSSTISLNKSTHTTKLYKSKAQVEPQTTVNESKTTNYNAIAIIEVLLGVLVVTKAGEVSRYLLKQIDEAEELSQA